MVEAAGVDRVQVDVMDGRFVPNITFGTIAVRSLRPLTRLTLEVHLMVTPPEDFIDAFAAAGADTLIVHQESTPHLHRALQHIHSLGKKAGVALNPSTPASTLSEVLEMVQLVLVMTVNPGFGGQEFIRVHAAQDPSGAQRARRARTRLRGGSGWRHQRDDHRLGRLRPARMSWWRAPPSTMHPMVWDRPSRDWFRARRGRISARAKSKLETGNSKLAEFSIFDFRSPVRLLLRADD